MANINDYCRPIRILIFLFLCLSLANACASTTNKASSTETGLLWEIRDQQSQRTSYLFGTIHSDDPRVTKIPPIVTFSFETSSLFILEVELTQKNTKQAMQAMFFTGNQTLEGILPTDLLNQCLKLLGQRGVSKQQAIKLKPWAVFTFLNTPNQEQAFLDQILYSNAKEKGIEIQGLESMAEQISVFDNLSMDIQVKLLQDSVNHFDELNHMLEQTIAVYLSRDLKRLEKFNQDYLTFTDEKTGQLLNDTLIIQRNYRMAKRLIPILQQHQAFIAVGALHLPGETGLIQLLRNHGYQLKPLY